MVAIPAYGDPTIQAMYKAIEAAQETRRRDYLGASLIGSPCSRQIFYDYNGYPKPPFEAETLMNFEDGHRTEDLTAERLRKIPGVQLWTRNQDNEQIGFVALNGKFKGHCDGIILGLLQAPKAMHVWECKASGQKKFDEFVKVKQTQGEKNALKNWNENYYVQAQLYMHFLHCDRHYITVALAGGRKYESARTEYDPVIAEQAINKAEKIINANQPPPRISENKDFWICRFCSFKDICHGTT